MCHHVNHLNQNSNSNLLNNDNLVRNGNQTRLMWIRTKSQEITTRLPHLVNYQNYFYNLMDFRVISLIFLICEKTRKVPFRFSLYITNKIFRFLCLLVLPVRRSLKSFVIDLVINVANYDSTRRLQGNIAQEDCKLMNSREFSCMITFLITSLKNVLTHHKILRTHNQNYIVLGEKNGLKLN